MKNNIRFVCGDSISDAVAKLYVHACVGPHKAVEQKLKAVQLNEKKGPGYDAISIEIENLNIAAKTGLPICQDTGTAVVFIEIGNQVCVSDTTLQKAIDSGIAKACKEGYLRPSQVTSPLGERKNTKNNTPAILHITHILGSDLKIFLLVKGAGSENVSSSVMLPPLAGTEGLIDLAEKCVRAGASKACPPVIIGIGVGGNLEASGVLAKKALLRDFDEINSDRELAELEKRITDRLNRSGIGPQGFGGNTTVIETRILQLPCHMASLPVTVCIECHAHRVASCEI